MSIQAYRQQIVSRQECLFLREIPDCSHITEADDFFLLPIPDCKYPQRWIDISKRPNFIKNKTRREVSAKSMASKASNLSKPKKAEIATHPFLVPIKDPKSEDEIDSLERGVLGENPEYYLA